MSADLYKHAADQTATAQAAAGPDTGGGPAPKDESKGGDVIDAEIVDDKT